MMNSRWMVEVIVLAAVLLGVSAGFVTATPTEYNFANLGAASGGFKPQGNRWLVSETFLQDIAPNETMIYLDVSSTSTTGKIIKADNINMARFDFTEMKFFGYDASTIQSMTITGTLAAGGTTSVTVTNKSLPLNTSKSLVADWGANLTAFVGVTQLSFDITLATGGSIYNIDFQSITIDNPFIDVTGTKPTVQATGLGATVIGSDEMTLSWTNGNGSARSVFALQGSSGTPPVADGTAYTPNTNFSAAADIGSGWRCLYRGTSNMVTVNGFTASSAYRFVVFECDGAGAGIKYLTTVGTNAANISTISSSFLSWTSGTARTLNPENFWSWVCSDRDGSNNTYVLHRYSGYSGGYTTEVQKWNGSAWSTLTSFTPGNAGVVGFSDYNAIDVTGVNTLQMSTGASWGSETSSARGIVHGAYNGSSWSYSTVVSYTDPNGWKNTYQHAIAVDGSGNPHVLYLWEDANTHTQYFALRSKSGTTWSETRLFSTIPSSNSYNQVKSTFQIMIDTSNRFHIVWLRENASGRTLYYSTNAPSGTWTDTAVLTNNTENLASLTAALDSSGKVHLALSFGAAGTEGTRYLTNASGSWVSTNLIPSGSGYWPAGLRLKSNNDIAISLIGASNTKVLLKQGSSPWYIGAALAGPTSKEGYYAVTFTDDDKVMTAYANTLSDRPRLLDYRLASIANAPAVTSVSVPANGTYKTGDPLNFTVNYSLPVTVNTGGGTPSFPLTLDTGGTVQAVYQSGSTTSALVFRYTVAAGNLDTNGISVGSAIALNGGTMKNAAGTVDAGLTLNGVGSTTGVRVDGVSPTVTLGSSAANPTNSSPIPVTITFSESVSGFAEGDLSVGNGSTSGFSGSGASYSVSITPSGQGSVTVNVAAGVATDAAGNGNTAATQLSRVYDSVAPTVGITSNPANPTSSTSATFTFTGSDPGGSGVTGFESRLDGGAWTAGGSPRTLNGLGDGSHTFEVRAIDAAGNISPVPAGFTWVVDSTAPDTAITGSPSNPSGSSSATFTFTGSDAGTGVAGYESRLDGGAWASCTSPQDFTGLSDGSHTYQVRSVDGVGNADASPAGFTWVVDTAPPDSSITGNPNNPSNSGSATFTFTGSDAGTGVTGFECQLDGGGWSAGTSPKTYTGLSDGSHTFQVRALDGIGNTDPTPAGFTWVVDTTPPDTVLTATPPNPSSSSAATFTFTGSDAKSGLAGFEASLDGAPYTAASSPLTYTGLADGSHTVQVRAKDTAGNVDPTPAGFTWVVDTTPPDTLLTGNPTNPTGSSSATFTFTGSDGLSKSVSGFECRLDGGAWVPGASPQSYSGLADGSHAFQVRAIDAAGNADPTPASYNWVVDTTPPGTDLTATPPGASNSSSATFAFNGSDPGGTGVVSYESRLDGGSWAPCTSPQTYTGLADGSHTFMVRAVDGVGNVDATPSSCTWTVDTVAPDTVLTSTPPDPSSSPDAAFTFSGSDPGGTGVTSYECQLDTGVWTPCTSPRVYTGLGGGSHTFRVRSLDVAGNTDPTPASFTWVIKFNTTTGLTSSANPSVYQQTVTFTATVTSTGGTPPTGTVVFTDGAATLGSAPLSGGVATLAISSLVVGGHSIAADYQGDGFNNTSTSPPLSQTVNKAGSTSLVVSSVNPSVFGQTVTFTATISANAPGGGTPTGVVSFFDGSTPLGTGTLNGSGVAALSTSTLTVGAHPVTVNYGGDGNFVGSTSVELNQDVLKTGTTTALTSSPNPSRFGQPVTFTATVTVNAPGSGTPTGTVTFLEGATTLGTGTLAGGTATFTTAGLSVATHNITARYEGDAAFNTSTATPVSQTVQKADTTTGLTSTPNPSRFGQAVTFTATVAVAAPGSGAPTGTVTFLEGTTTLGTGTLAGGTATFTTAGLSVGAHPVTARYEGDASFNTSTASPVTQTVQKADTTTATASSANPSRYGQGVTFTATVAAVLPGSGTPTGTVTFLEGATTLGTGTLAGGTATFTTAGLSVGAHPVTARYEGDASFNTSTAATVNQEVQKSDSATAVVSSANPSVWGQGVTFTATVTAAAPGSGTPTGTVTFRDGAATLGTGTLDGSGAATLATGALEVASHPITASYGGDGNFNGGTSAVLSQVVNKAGTATALALSASPVCQGEGVTFTATVTVTAPGAGTPAGTVTFYDDATPFGTGTLDGSGVATLTTTAMAPGTRSVSAAYGGDAHVAASTSPGTPHTVNPLPAPVIGGPTTVCLGSSVTLDAGADYASYRWFPGGETTRAITVSPATATAYTVAVTTAAGCAATSPAHTVTIKPVTVITASPQSRTIWNGQTATLSVTATGLLLHYQWYRGVSGDVSQPLGGDANTYTTPVMAETTPFWVRVTGGCGPADSATAWVTVRQVGSHAVIDFDGNGITDIFWRNDDLDVTSSWLIGEAGAVTGLYLGSTGGGGWVVESVDEFTADGLDDILWRNSFDGEILMWFLGRSGVAEVRSPGTVDPAWEIIGSGDTDGDGKADLFWRNDDLGLLSLWFMNGPSVVGSLDLGSVGTPDWQVIGTADFDHSGTADLLWRHEPTGAVSIWLLNERGFASDLSPGTMDPAWKVIGLGDVDRDGCADIFWRQATTGALSVWLIDATGFRNSISLGTVSDLAWKVRGVGDFNGDGRTDLLWRNTITGDLSFWYLHEQGVVGTPSPATVNLGWETLNHVNLNVFPVGGGKVEDMAPEETPAAAASSPWVK